MAESYALISEYRLISGDTASSDDRVEAMLANLSAKLRVMAGISSTRKLTDDQRELCKTLVIDAARNALVTPDIPMFDGASMDGITQATFSANGFSGSWQMASGSGYAYFNSDALRALRKSLGTSQSVGTMVPSYGRLQCRG